MSIHIVLFLGEFRCWRRGGYPLSLTSWTWPVSHSLHQFHIRGLIRRGQVQDLIKTTKYWILPSSRRVFPLKPGGFHREKVEETRGYFCHVLAGTPWPFNSRMIEQYPRKDTQGHPGDLGTSIWERASEP